MEDPPVHHGYLLTPPQGKLLKRKWERKYYALYKASNYAVERVEVFENEEGYQHKDTKRIIPLNDCVKVTQVPQKNQQNVFEVMTKKQVYQFSSETTQALPEWVSAFQMVAFGGRKCGISTTPPYLLSPSPSLLIKSEDFCFDKEENQIYSTCSWPEIHPVQIVDTEASTACNLNGNYLLVVSPLYLLLFEDGANINSQEPLYVWPYRHIRRYGRSKDAFTFEAGRKCPSGEGTFTLATAEANDIFLRVQANTRTLKYEREESFSPSVLLSKPHFTSLSVSGLKSESFPAEILQRKISLDAAGRASRNGPPFAKPPRKVKLNSVSGGDDSKISPTEPIRLEISNAARAKLAATSSLRNNQNLPSNNDAAEEPTYAEPEVRKDAWKTFGLETDNIHSEKVYYASVPLSPTPTTTTTQFPPVKEQINRILTPPKRSDSGDDNCYDHLSQFGSVQSTKTTENEGHIYSRLVSVPEQASSQYSSSDYESVLDPEELMPETMSKKMNDGDDDIKRFLQNEQVYTVVTKKAWKESPPLPPQSDSNN